MTLSLKQKPGEQRIVLPDSSVVYVRIGQPQHTSWSSARVWVVAVEYENHHESAVIRGLPAAVRAAELAVRCLYTGLHA